MTADLAVREVHRSQGAANVTVRNIVTSLRVIVEVDWKELFERYCLVDGALAKRGAFSQMDFATRTLYRSAVEELARGSLHDELDIARLAVAAAGAPHPSLPALEQSRRADSGYYLIAGGRREFEASIGFRRFPFLPARAMAKLNFIAYAGSIVATSFVLLMAPIFALAKMGVGAVELTLLALVGAISAVDVAVAVVNRTVTLFVRAVALPALALRDGVPASLRTLVAVPTLLTTREDIAELVERLESITWRVPKAICTSLSCRIGSMPTSRAQRATRRWWSLPAKASMASTNATALRRRVHGSSYCTAGAYGAKPKRAGSGGNANGVSFTS